MVWEIVFMLVILKIPIAYMCAVIWWATKEKPQPDDPVEPVPALREGDRGPRDPLRRPDRGRPWPRRPTRRPDGRLVARARAGR